MSVLPPLAATPVVTARSATTLTVLVADDDADMRLYLKGCLHTMDLPRVLEAVDGREALQLVLIFAPDLVISDIVMPGLDGLALRRALQADPATAAIPFLLISGESYASPDGADGFLAKPFNATQLRVEVERLLGPPA